MTMKEYYAYKKCADCDIIMYFSLTKVEAAFGLYHIPTLIKKNCLNCKSLHFSEFSAKVPKVDEELLNLWGDNPDLHFSEQDEEIILAKIEHLGLFLDAIDNSNYPQAKKDILLGAVCVLYYDSIVSDTIYTDDEKAERKAIVETVLPELVKRKDLIKALPGWQLGEYITMIVYPAIGLQ